MREVEGTITDRGLDHLIPKSTTSELEAAFSFSEAHDNSALALSEAVGLNAYSLQSHEDNLKWWVDADGNSIAREKGTLLMLIVSEIAEAMEGERKRLMDDKLPHRLMAEVELADALIRIFDYAGAFGYDLEGAYQEKRAYNAQRADHTYEARAQAGGKAF